MPTLQEILKTKIGKGSKSKAYVASKLGISEKTVENYMNGKREPKPDRLIKLGEILGFELSELSEQSVPRELSSKTTGNQPDAKPGTNDIHSSTIYHLAEGNRIQSETNHTVALTNQRLVEQNIALTQAYTGNADHHTIDETVLLVKALKDYLIEAVSELKKVPPQEVIQALYNKVNEVKDSRGKKDRQPEAGSKSSLSR